MITVYILDACAVFAVLANEPGADKVVEVYKKAALGEVSLVVNKLNLLEVYYGLFYEGVIGKFCSGKPIDSLPTPYMRSAIP